VVVVAITYDPPAAYSSGSTSGSARTTPRANNTQLSRTNEAYLLF